MARGLCNVLPGLALALRSKPGNHGAKLGYFLLAFRVLVEAAHPDLADADRKLADLNAVKLVHGDL